ncbi:MAG: hypothetical protein U1E36_00385 [Rickettsiales bacterium]
MNELKAVTASMVVTAWQLLHSPTVMLVRSIFLLGATKRGTDTLLHINSIMSSSFGDNLTGNANANQIDGGEVAMTTCLVIPP